jgi:hypothetical protein
MSVDLSQKRIQKLLEKIAYEQYDCKNYECAKITLSLCQKDLSLKGMFVRGNLLIHVGQLEEALKVLVDIEETLST